MNIKEKETIIGINKTVPITALFITALLIVFSGAAFIVYSVVNNINFTVLNSQIHGGIFGVIVLFLGVRYLLSTQKLKAEVYKTTNKFSWDNFRFERKHKGF